MVRTSWWNSWTFLYHRVVASMFKFLLQRKCLVSILHKAIVVVAWKRVLIYSVSGISVSIFWFIHCVETEIRLWLSVMGNRSVLESNVWILKLYWRNLVHIRIRRVMSFINLAIRFIVLILNSSTVHIVAIVFYRVNLTYVKLLALNLS